MPSRFPHEDPFIIQARSFSAQMIIDTIGPLMVGPRRERIEQVVARRSYTIVPVLEGLYDRGNVSAVMRTAEALGFQAFHIIESSKRFKRAKRVTQGAEKWLDVTTYEETAPCLDYLKARGYRIMAASFEDATPIAEVDFQEPAAIFFGNEKDGLSEEALAAADQRIIVPMPGFTKSYNISVAAALTLYHIYNNRVTEATTHGDLTLAEQKTLTASYYLRSVDRAEEVLLKATAGE